MRIDPRAKAEEFERSLPRMRGDRPRIVYWYDEKTGFTPHARGSTPGCIGHTRKHTVYPACAGIDLLLIATLVDGGCLPRMRGDRPSSGRRFQATTGFTPHARGSTCRWMYASINSVYPHARIDLLWSYLFGPKAVTPHARIDPKLSAWVPISKRLPHADRPRVQHPSTCLGCLPRMRDRPFRGTHVPYW